MRSGNVILFATLTFLSKPRGQRLFVLIQSSVCVTYSDRCRRSQQLQYQLLQEEIQSAILPQYTQLYSVNMCMLMYCVSFMSAGSITVLSSLFIFVRLSIKTCKLIVFSMFAVWIVSFTEVCWNQQVHENNMFIMVLCNFVLKVSVQVTLL